jgi:hypothetical protein
MRKNKCAITGPDGVVRRRLARIDLDLLAANTAAYHLDDDVAFE